MITVWCALAWASPALAQADSAAAIDVRLLMPDSVFRAAGLNRLSRDQLASLNAWLGAYTRTVALASEAGPGTAETPPPGRDYPRSAFARLRGAWIVAHDGQRLGVISADAGRRESLLNRFGPYGNQFNSRSIFDRFGPYGSATSDLSPFDPTAAHPPVIRLRGRVVAYFTVNEAKSPRVDPRALIAWLRAQ